MYSPELSDTHMYVCMYVHIHLYNHEGVLTNIHSNIPKCVLFHMSEQQQKQQISVTSTEKQISVV